PLDPERARALMMLHGEVRRAAEITQHFLELAQHPSGAAEPSDCSIVLNGVLAEREGTLKELGVKLVRSIPHELPMVACPMAQLTEMLMKLLDFALRRLRDSQPPRELRIAVSETGPSLTISLWDSGTPLSVEAEQRLVTPFRFTQSAGGGEIEFALARALAQSSGGTLRLRPRGGGGAEVVVTLPKSVLAPLARATPSTPPLPKLRILVVDDDAVNRQAMRLLLEREGHEVVAVENGLEAIERLGPASDRFDAVVTDLQMPRLGGRAPARPAPGGWGAPPGAFRTRPHPGPSRKACRKTTRSSVFRSNSPGCAHPASERRHSNATPSATASRSSGPPSGSTRIRPTPMPWRRQPTPACRVATRSLPTACRPSRGCGARWATRAVSTS